MGPRSSTTTCRPPRTCNNSHMRAIVLLFLAGCATTKLTPREGVTAGDISPEETAAWEAAWEAREAAREASTAVTPPAAAPPPPPVAAPAPPRPVEARPTPGALSGATVATVVLHTPAGDMEVKCPNVCPPGQACMQPVVTDPGPSGPTDLGFDLLKEVLMPLAAAIGGMLAGLFIKKGKRNGR